MYGEKLTPSERRSVIGFIFMMGIGGLIIFFIRIANDSEWGSNQWAGVSAIANWVEALAVVGALVYAGVQLRASRDLDNRRRYSELVDRLDRIVHEELEPAVQRAKWTASYLHSEIGWRDDPELEPTEAEMLGRFMAESIRKLDEALHETRSILRRARRYALPVHDEELTKVISKLDVVCMSMMVATWGDPPDVVGKYIDDVSRKSLEDAMAKLSKLTLGHVERSGVDRR